MPDAAPDPLRLLRVEHAVSEVLLDCRTSEEAFLRSLDAIGGEFGWEHAGLWIPGEAGMLRCSSQWQAPGTGSESFALASRGLALPVGRGLPGRVWAAGQPAWVADIAADDDFPRAAAAAEAGLRTAVAFPLQGPSGVLAVTEVLTRDVQAPDPDLMATLMSIGRRVGQFVEHGRAEAAVARSEARKRAILDAALDCIITIDHHGRVVEANSAIERVFGWTAEESVGREMAELMVPPELREAHRAGVARVVRGDPPRLLGHRVELPAVRKDGRRIPVELTITRIVVSKRPMFTGHVRDITDRVEAEAELKASRARVVQAGDEARKRIERDLHDGAQQRLVALALTLRLAENRVLADPEAGLELLREAQSDLSEATTELRELARGIASRRPDRVRSGTGARGAGAALAGPGRHRHRPARAVRGAD